MSWNITANLNPEFVRSLRVALPRRRAVFLAALTIAIIAAGGWLLWGYNYPTYGQLTDAQRAAVQQINFGRQSFEILTVGLFCLLFILAPATAGLSFIQERLRGTSIFLQMSLLSPFRLAAGKFFGSGLLAYFIAAMLVPCALVAAALGGVDKHVVLRLYLFLMVGALCWQSIGIFVSSALSGPAEKALRGGLLVGPAVGVGGAITALAFYDYFVTNAQNYAGGYYANRYWWHFYGAAVPAYVMILGVMVFVGVWAFVGATRRIKAWQLIPLRPHAVWLFFASASLLLIGLLWGRHEGDIEPADRIVVYLFLNWVALTVLAGSSALTRGRLREWWSAERDPLAVFQREDIKNALKTFLFVLGIAEAGLVALWYSYHVTPDGALAPLAAGSQLAPIAVCFAATIIGMALFIQFCAMYRFRIGGWAGVCLTVIFYLFMGIAGAMFDRDNNTTSLINPLVYAEVVTKGDVYMDSHYNAVRAQQDLDNTYRGTNRKYFETGGDSNGGHTQLYYRIPSNLPVQGVEYITYHSVVAEVDSARVRGFVAEGLLAILCFGMAYVKWTRTREEMLEEGSGVGRGHA